jgi:hypothetical protein
VAEWFKAPVLKDRRRITAEYRCVISCLFFKHFSEQQMHPVLVRIV